MLAQQVGGMGSAHFTQMKQHQGLSQSSRAGLVLPGQTANGAACVRWARSTFQAVRGEHWRWRNCFPLDFARRCCSGCPWKAPDKTHLHCHLPLLSLTLFDRWQGHRRTWGTQENPPALTSAPVLGTLLPPPRTLLGCCVGAFLMLR